MRTLRSAFSALFHRSRVEQDLQEELRFHIDSRAEDLQRSGLSNVEAQRRARVEFGAFEDYKEQCRETLMTRLLSELLGDVRYALRTMRQSPGFTFVAILTLALGIGANTAIFGLMNAVLLKALPVRDPGQLVLFGAGEWVGIQDGLPDRSWQLFSYATYRDLRSRNRVFSDVLAVNSMPNRVHAKFDGAGGGRSDEPLNASLVSGNYFSVLGVNAAIGRTFSAADDVKPGGHPVVVLSDSLWQRRFGRDVSAVGKTVAIGSTAYTIIGVTPSGFFGTSVGEPADLWIPLAMEEQVPPGWKGLGDKMFQSLYLIGRLKPGGTREQASANINLLFRQIVHDYAGPQPSKQTLQDIQKARIDLTPAGRGLSQLRLHFSLPLKILMVVVGLVLVIACANIANLLLARATARQREIAVRLAIGAGRGRLLRQFLTESTVLAFAGAAAGVLIAWWGTGLLVGMLSTGAQPLHVPLAPDGRVLAFTIAVSFLTGILFGLSPALHAMRLELSPSLRKGKGTGCAPARSPMRNALVVAQVAISVLLLVGSGLFVRSLINLHNVDAGFRKESVLVFQLDTDSIGYKEDSRLTQLYRRIEERVSALPGVRAASFSQFAFNQGVWSMPLAIENGPRGAATDREVHNNIVGPGYFDAIGLPVLVGRGFGPADTEKSPKVAIINETMARRDFPNESPIGKRFGLGGAEHARDIEIVGVVKDAKYERLHEKTPAMAYYSYAQQPGFLSNFAVGCAGAPNALVSAVRSAIHEVDADLPVSNVRTLARDVEESLVTQTLIAQLSAFFGALALLLSCVGIYGLLSYGVAQRTNEIGLRMALGARGDSVRWMVLRNTLGLTLIGIALGVALAFATVRYARSLLFGLTASDPVTLAFALFVMLLVATLAGYIPARRASRIDPMKALRCE